MHALQVLEFDAVVQRLLGRCETSLGYELAESLQPSFKDDEVWASLALTREAYDLLGRGTPPCLGAVRDVRDAVIRAGKGGTLNGAEVFTIGEGMSVMRAMKAFLSGIPEGANGLKLIAVGIPEHARLDQMILDSVLPDGDLKDSASPKLGTLRSRKRSIAARIIEKIHSYTTGRFREYLSDPIYTVRDGRYVVPVKAEHRGKIRGIVHDTSGSGQTVYIEPEDVLQQGNALREAESAEREEVTAILRNLSERIGVVADDILAGLDATAQLDLLLAKARLAGDMKGAIPDQASTLGTLEVELAKHPLLDPAIVVPLSMNIGGSHGSVLITGPNTGGKTVAMKCLGLCVLMAQSGMFPPAAHVKLGTFSQVWADIGDEQSLQQSLSTFGAHIKNIAEALRGVRPHALVLMDEIGAGTDPAEGAALAKAILTTLRDAGATIVASTHYGELKNFAFNAEGFTNAAMEFDAKTLKPTYRVMVGAAGASHALKIAERYGIPKAVVEAALDVLGEEARDMAAMLERLEDSQRQARRAQGEADRRLSELKRKEQEADKKLKEAEQIRQNARDKAAQALEEVLRDIRLEADQVFEELRKSGSGDQAARDQARKALRDLQEIGGGFAAEVKRPAKAAPAAQVQAGDQVRATGLTGVGTVLEADRKQAVVQMGALKMTFPLNQLTKVEAVVERKAKRNIGYEKAQVATTEIQLIGMRAEEAQEKLDAFLDEAILGGVPNVRIVHGKGEGILRQVTRDVLRRNRSVAEVRDGEPAEGGAGVTIATFR